MYGSEVKAIREGRINIKESYVRFVKSELFVIGMHIGEYSNTGYSTHSLVRDRKLLLHKGELLKIKQIVEQKGKTLIPLKIYLKRSYIKLEFALAKGKKLWDKRKSKMDNDILRNINRELKKNI